MAHPLRPLVAAVLAAALPAAAAVTSAQPSSFLISHRVELNAAPMAVFEAIGQPARWWSGQHTYSGQAGNLRMQLAAGGCFCEAWDRNSVEHGRIVYAAPAKAVRLAAALGPMQAMAVTGILDFRIEPRGTGSTLSMTYRVRGTADAELDKLAPAVDKVMVEQVDRLAAFVAAASPPDPATR